MPLMSESAARPVVVRDRLTRPHQVVVATQTAAAGATPDATGTLELGYRGPSARLTVSRVALPRALRLLDAFCKGAGARGWTVSVGTKYTGKAVTQVAFEDRTVRFAITEDTDKQSHALTKYHHNSRRHRPRCGMRARDTDDAPKQ